MSCGTSELDGENTCPINDMQCHGTPSHSMGLPATPWDWHIDLPGAWSLGIVMEVVL